MPLASLRWASQSIHQWYRTDTQITGVSIGVDAEKALSVYSYSEPYWPHKKYKVPFVLTALNWSPAFRSGACCHGCDWAESGWPPHTAAAVSCLQTTEWPGEDQPAAPWDWKQSYSTNNSSELFSQHPTPPVLWTFQHTTFSKLLLPFTCHHYFYSLITANVTATAVRRRWKMSCSQ